MLLALRVPAGNNRGPLFVEQSLAAIHQGNHGRLPVTLGLARVDGRATLTCRFPAELRGLVEGHLYAHFPDAGLTPIATECPAADERVWTAGVTLANSIFPIKRHPQFEDALTRQFVDPLSGLLALLGRDHASGLRATAEICIRPARHKRIRRAHRCLHRLAAPFFRKYHQAALVFVTMSLSPYGPVRVAASVACQFIPHDEPHAEGLLHQSGTRQHDREDDLQAAADKLGRLLFECQIRLTVTGPAEAGGQAKKLLRELAGTFGQYSVPRLASFHLGPVAEDAMARDFAGQTFLLSTEELATLWHPATETVRAPGFAQVESREFPAPVNLPTPASAQDLAVLGVTAFRGTSRPFGLLLDDRRRHLAVLGKTGMGKTTLLHHLIASDIQAGRGVGLIDPHGDLADALLAAVPRRRTNEVVVFDAGDVQHPLSFNVLDCPNRALRPLAASAIVASFKKLYADSWGPRLEHILRNAVLALLDVPGTSLVSLLRLLGEARYRADIAGRVADPIVRAFWQREFAGLPPKLQVEAVAPIQNKVGHFVSSPILRHIVGQSRNALPLRRLMDDGQVLIANLSKGRIGDDASKLLGSFLVTGIQLAAMSRAATPEGQRRDFFLYVDEFQNFATESFSSILSEARKYRLSLTVANQYLGQLDEATLHALFGNVGTLVSFQVGARDAELLADQFGGDLTIQDLLRLPRYQAYVRLLVEGMPSMPFSMRTQPPPRPHKNTARPTVIRRASRHRYGRPVAEIETQIAAAIGGGG